MGTARITKAQRAPSPSLSRDRGKKQRGVASSNDKAQNNGL